MGEKPQEILEYFAFFMFLVTVELGTVLKPVREGKEFLNDVPVPLFVVFFPLFLNWIEVD